MNSKCSKDPKSIKVMASYKRKRQEMDDGLVLLSPWTRIDGIFLACLSIVIGLV